MTALFYFVNILSFPQVLVHRRAFPDNPDRDFSFILTEIFLTYFFVKFNIYKYCFAWHIIGTQVLPQYLLYDKCI